MSVHLVVHAAPERMLTCSEVTLGGHSLEALSLPTSWLSRPLAVSFDEVLSRLEQLPRLYIEPDGSFIWIGPTGPAEWKIDGQLHDSASGLMTIELKVEGDSPDLCAIFHCLDWPAESLVFQLVREGIYVDDYGLSSRFSQR